MAGHRATEGGPRGVVRYGKKNAETDERYHAKVLERQLEALANEPEPPPEGAAAQEAPEPAPAPAPPPERGAPIGALQPPDEEPAKPVLREAVNEAERRFEAVAAASRQLLKAASRLVRLPWELLRDNWRRVGRRPGWT